MGTRALFLTTCLLMTMGAASAVSDEPSTVYAREPESAMVSSLSDTTYTLNGQQVYSRQNPLTGQPMFLLCPQKKETFIGVRCTPKPAYLVDAQGHYLSEETLKKLSGGTVSVLPASSSTARTGQGTPAPAIRQADNAASATLQQKGNVTDALGPSSQGSSGGPGSGSAAH